LEKKGVKGVLFIITVCETVHLTVMLAATADGRKLPHLKKKTLPKSEAFPKGPGKRMDDGGADVGVAENSTGLQA
jgi:hypothetical protein